MRLYKQINAYSTYFINEKTNRYIGKDIYHYSNKYRYRDFELFPIKKEIWSKKIENNNIYWL